MVFQQEAKNLETPSTWFKATMVANYKWKGKRVLLIPTLALERFLSASVPYAPETEEGLVSSHNLIHLFSFENLRRY